MRSSVFTLAVVLLLAGCAANVNSAGQRRFTSAKGHGLKPKEAELNGQIIEVVGYLGYVKGSYLVLLDHYVELELTPQLEQTAKKLVGKKVVVIGQLDVPKEDEDPAYQLIDKNGVNIAQGYYGRRPSTVRVTTISKK